MVKARHSRVQKSWMTRWSWVFLLSVLTMFMFLLILLLLALHLLSMPTSFAPVQHNHLNSIARNASYMYSFSCFTCFIQLHYFPPLVSLISFFLFHFSAEAKEKMNRESNGLKYYHGSLGLFSITIFWSVLLIS